MFLHSLVAEDEGLVGTTPPCSRSTFFILWYYNGVNYFINGVGIIVNVLTIVIISKFKVRTRAHKLMATLAIADIGQCIGTFLNIPKLNEFILCFHDIWLVLCKMQIVFMESMVAIGAYVYLMLTIDRFVAIVWALQYKTIMTKTKYVIYTVFLLTHHFILFFVSYMFFPNENLWGKKMLCRRGCQATNFINTVARYYMLAFITMLVLINITLCVVLVIYLFIVRKRRRSLAGTDGGSDGLSKATNTLIFVSALYALLYVQLVVFMLVAAFDPTTFTLFIGRRADTLFLINNVINPFVYFVRMPDFRAGFYNLIGCKRKTHK